MKLEDKITQSVYEGIARVNIHIHMVGLKLKFPMVKFRVINRIHGEFGRHRWMRSTTDTGQTIIAMSPLHYSEHVMKHHVKPKDIIYDDIKSITLLLNAIYGQ